MREVGYTATSQGDGKGISTLNAYRGSRLLRLIRSLSSLVLTVWDRTANRNTIELFQPLPELVRYELSHCRAMLSREFALILTKTHGFEDLGIYLAFKFLDQQRVSH